MSAQATFGAGCFWGVEARFRQLPGVIDAAVGYMGGRTEQPSYQEVCSDTTGHVEVCQVSFDPERCEYETLVRGFFSMHDPTQVNRQGPDVGTQYRSVIFYADAYQQQTAERIKAELDASGRFSAPIATRIEPAQQFWRAEEYHQRYLERRGGSCAI